MSKNPYVNFYTSDFLAGTSGLTAATKGIYITLLCMMYETESPLSQSYGSLARRCGASNSSFKKSLQELVEDGKIVIGDGGIWSPKVEKHISTRQDRSRRNAKSASVRWEKTKQKQSDEDANAQPAQCQPEPEPEPEPYTLSNESDGGAVLRLPDDVDREFVWSRGVEFLCRCGVPDRQARSVIGKWLKDANPREVREAFRSAQMAKTRDPVPYITEALKPRPEVDLDAIFQSIGEKKRAK